MDYTQEISGAGDQAAAKLNAAAASVEAATHHVDEVKQHFARQVGHDAVNLRQWLEATTRRKPLTMLSLAFVAGVIFIRR